MAKPNYSFAKRQRDLAKEQKKEEKAQRKQAALSEPQLEDGETAAADETAEQQGEEKPTE